MNCEKLVAIYDGPGFSITTLNAITLKCVKAARNRLSTYKFKTEGEHTSGKLYKSILRTMATHQGNTTTATFYNSASYARQFEFGVGRHSAMGPRPFMYWAVNHVLTQKSEAGSLIQSALKGVGEAKNQELSKVMKSLSAEENVKIVVG